MREETPALTQPAPSDSPSMPSGAPNAAEPRVRRPVWGLPVALAVVAAAAILGWQIFELRSSQLETREEVAQRLASGDAAVAELRALSRQQQESIAALQGKIGALEAHVAATEGQTAALEELYQEFSRTREDRALAEAEQAINIAAQQLQLAGNFEAALIALQGAEARLAALDRGQLQPLRLAITRDIERLKTTPRVDVQGIALRLEALLESVDALPLAFAAELEEGRPAAEGTADEARSGERPVIDFITGLARDVWNEIRSLVRVERLDQSDPALLAPAQSTFLRENLKVRLLTARLALLARDGSTYAADLAQARNWLERFFDTSDPAVQRARAELAALQAMPVKVEQPAPSESFAALQRLQAQGNEVRARQGRGSNRGVARDAAAGAPEPAAADGAGQQGPLPDAPPAESAEPAAAGGR